MNSEEIKKKEDHLNDLQKRTKEQLIELDQYLKGLDDRFLIGYRNIKFLVFIGCIYATTLILFGVSDIMKGRWIFGSFWIVAAISLLIASFRALRINYKFFKQYILEKQNAEKI